jgi:hypothetical protein
MSYVIAEPELMTSAAGDLAAIGSNVSAAHTAAAARTLVVLPAAADEVSASVAHLFSQHAADYQAMAAQAAAFQEQFVQNLTAGAFSYADIEAAITVFLLRPLFALVTGGVGGFFLGGVGQPGLLPLLAEQFFISTSGNTPLGLALNPIRIPIDFLLFPLLFVYDAETGVIPL